MTHDPNGTNPDDPHEGVPGGSGEVGPKLDEDAAWRAIIEHYGERAELEEDDAPPVAPPAAPLDPPRFPSFERRWTPEPLNSEATWDDEGHFVPPEPPPLPQLEPRRKLAWIGLFGAPLMMLVAVVLGWSYPSWLSFLLVAGFVGGFGYLVATMPRSRGDDGSGDNGAIV